ncbi:hypothetical protein ACFFX0_11310 [Citricoccus parietis]|uniref:Uncharacterized protein n=1 Tax=Citricoccus parietis TaxID=592307 RepID=A0ABV5FZU1_9MICC
MPGLRAQPAGEGGQHRGLAGSVGPGQGQGLALVHGEGEVHPAFGDDHAAVQACHDCAPVRRPARRLSLRP